MLHFDKPIKRQFSVTDRKFVPSHAPPPFLGPLFHRENVVGVNLCTLDIHLCLRIKVVTFRFCFSRSAAR